MNLREYLVLKYGQTHWALTRLEAECFGVDYPLVGGWVDAHVSEITREQLENLSNKLEKKTNTTSQKAYDFVSTLLRK